MFLLAGISYYKIGAPPHDRRFRTGSARRAVDSSPTSTCTGWPSSPYRTGVDPPRPRRSTPPAHAARPAVGRRPAGASLIPFGGGIDSIVVVDGYPQAAAGGAALSWPTPRTCRSSRSRIERGDRRSAGRARPDATSIRRSSASGARVCSTATCRSPASLSAIAVLLRRRAMAATASSCPTSTPPATRPASRPTACLVNHQWSKGVAFEGGFRAVLAESRSQGVDYYSALRPFSELLGGRAVRRADRRTTMPSAAATRRSSSTPAPGSPLVRALRQVLPSST